jgi:hypothetical protein
MSNVQHLEFKELMFFLRGFTFLEFFKVWHTHNGLVFNSVMTTNNIDLPSSLKGEIQLATMTIVVVRTIATIVVIVAIVATSTLLVAKTNNIYFTSPIWSLCKFSHVFVQIIFDFN